VRIPLIVITPSERSDDNSMSSTVQMWGVSALLRWDRDKDAGACLPTSKVLSARVGLCIHSTCIPASTGAQQAESWAAEGKPFPGLVWWHRWHYETMSSGDFVAAFEERALRDDSFAGYPIVHIKLQSADRIKQLAGEARDPPPRQRLRRDRGSGRDQRRVVSSSRPPMRDRWSDGCARSSPPSARR